MFFISKLHTVYLISRQLAKGAIITRDYAKQRLKVTLGKVARDMGQETTPTTDGEVAKRLFTPSPEKAATVRDPLHKHWGSKGRNNFGIGVWGALIFLVLCISVVLVTVRLNSSWTDITLEGSLCTIV